MKSFTAHSWLEFWFYGLYPALIVSLTYIGVLATLALWPFAMKSKSNTCERCKNRDKEDSTEWASTSATFTTPDARPRQNQKAFESEPSRAQHPTFRYSFIPPSPFGAGTPIRVPSLRTSSPYQPDGAPVRVRSLRHFLLPPPLSRHRVDGEQGSDGAQTPDKTPSVSRRLSAVAEDTVDAIMV
ncbi:hypothetical protein G6011_00784 [Alternaria panax]|uniref:Uncharacterized protein n=1 Tax=Alternaria panax TaxID=48097 RepID=A0AAD4IIX8_9PLEO|nr:hypothetical protein G6011_00784 [Alternaria panax]